MITGSRIHHMKRNLIASYVNMVVQMLFKFLSRSVIVYTLGEEYLGISGLFASILQVLNMAEMGFSGAIVYNMYRPIASGDITTVCKLLSYYKKIYRIIGCTILTLGIMLIPFLPYLIKGNPPQEINVTIVYILYLINTSISYFLFAYKTSLLEAMQRLDLTKITTTLVNVIQYTLQILSLLVFKDFYLFLVISILGVAGINIFNAIISNKYYPEYIAEGEINRELKLDIRKRVEGLIICNVSGITYTTLDSIIISAFIGLTSVAIYGNYLAVFSAVEVFVTAVRGAVQASVGNSVASEDINKNYNDLLLFQYLFSAIGTWCVTCLVCLCQPFMNIWMGKNMLLHMGDVIILSAWFLVSVVQNAHFLYLSANGLWIKLKWVYIFSTIVNLIMNLVLGKLLGITGIILASFLAVLIFGGFWQCNIIFREYFNLSPKRYYIFQFIYLFIAIIVVSVTYLICNTIDISGIFGLIAKGAICSIVSMAMILVIYHKFPPYERSKKILIEVVKRKTKQKERII